MILKHSEQTSPTSIFHVLKASQFNRATLDELCALTSAIRMIAKSNAGSIFLQSLLADKSAMLYFTQPSTRTYVSFERACQILGIKTTNIRDRSTSSEVKGESQMDSLRTLSSFVNLIIMRTPEAGLAEEAAALFSRIKRRVPIINAGSGKDEHPTQALLDIYTLERSFQDRGGIDEKVIGMMGDLKRGRTVRSLCQLMRCYRNVKLVFIAPDAFFMEDDIKNFLRGHHISFLETDNMHSVLPELDAIYITRIQDEHDQAGESRKVDLSRFKLRPEHLGLMKSDAAILHPLPRRDEIHPDIDDDSRVKYWRQMRNGMWMRAALLIKIFRVENAIRPEDWL